ncbi:hypothetical protein GCM10022295_04360 [Streptomyces osmaniensis]|uniref:Uncharacterized protein n=1 Tax=Streptomyces osmaniensis TaxID=593134 RepID=A0ABP6V3D0_9ACTN
MHVDVLAQHEVRVRVLGEDLPVDTEEFGQVRIGDAPHGQRPIAAVGEKRLISAATQKRETFLRYSHQLPPM